MGKDSLIKSTSKKKDDAKKSKKKVAAKSAKKTTAAKPAKAKKTAAKTKAKSKTTKKAAAKPAPKKAPAKKAVKKPVAKKKAKKLTVKELLMLKFESTPPTFKAKRAAKSSASVPPAPPLIASNDPKEVARLRAILSQKFSMEEITAAAKAPAPTPVSDTTADPAPAPEQASADPATTEPESDETPSALKSAGESAYITTEPPESDGAADPVTRAAKIAIALAAAVVFLLLSISYNNSNKYYITPKDNAIEIWKGRFSPKDNKFYMVLHGTELTEPAKPVYSSKEVFPLIFNYYLNKADTLLEVPGLPDYKGIKDYLHQAKDYAINSEMNNTVYSRLDTIERNTLLFKADVSLSKKTIDSQKTAIKLLKQSAKLSPSATQADEINAKIATARESILAIKAAEKEADQK